jgi:phage major head subunit gpT-like protein
MRLSNKNLRRIIREEKVKLIREQGWRDSYMADIVDVVQRVFDDGGGFWDIAGALKAEGYLEVTASTSPISIVTFKGDTGEKIAILPKSMAESPDAVVGNFAIGVME